MTHPGVRADSGSTKHRIIAAAFDALATHGYADLSIKAIGDELGQSPSLIYYHFDDKDDLLLALLDFHLAQFTAEYIDGAGADPETNLRAFVDKLLPETVSADKRTFLRVYAELRAQAAQSEAYREKFTELDSLLVATVSDFIEAGIEAGQFADVDVPVAAEHLVGLLLYAMQTRATTTRTATISSIRAALDSVLDDLRSEAVRPPS
ncbi:TetR/AcrR family transcriptional regulator [Haladaptatus sp. CMSO5]|uniref:TetR/AcrR family transcriptional regulator n=1 Tax=Haladaptatus sp. CMSO5 TaxID=3120514 RepID=UPI002FCE4DFB